MNLANNAIINIYSIAILVIIYFHSSKQSKKESLQHRIYTIILQITMVMLVVDILGRFDGKADTIYPVINYFGNFTMFLLSPTVPSLWLLYAHYEILKEEKKTKGLIYPLIFINVINICILLLTQIFGWYYYIDSDNIYHRGPLFWLSFSIQAFLIGIAFAFIVINRKKVKKGHYFSLIFFAIPPLICMILQAAFYGFSLVLNGIVLSLFIVFLKIQNQSMYIDYLTGIYNRKKLEDYLKEKVRESTKDKTFSAILIDLNNFKFINDTFGHNEGDKALKIFAKLLNNCLRPNDFIARFGGDEFCIVLDVSEKKHLEQIIYRIDNCIAKYNQSGEQPYTLAYGIGYAVYDYNSYMKVEEFQKHIDTLMYESKKAKKEEEENDI